MIKMFCDVCKEEATKNEAAQMIPFEVPVDPANGQPPVVVSLVIGIGIGAQGNGEICPACLAKTGHAALAAFAAM
jgi:hypothetical protein